MNSEIRGPYTSLRQEIVTKQLENSQRTIGYTRHCVVGLTAGALNLQDRK